MVDTLALRGCIVAKGETQKSMAHVLNISETTFSNKMKRKMFNSDEMYTMIKHLGIEDPARIFFADQVK